MKKSKPFILESVAVLLFLLYMLPFALILINTAKPTLQILIDPLAWPEKFSLMFTNIQSVYSSPNIKYPSAFMSSAFITAGSCALLVLISSMAAWVLVRTKTKLSGAIFMMFVAAMVIPFQVVMFPLVNWFFTIESALGLRNLGPGFRILYNYPGIILAYMGFGTSLSIFLYHGFIKSVPLELEEAATIDGCSRAKTFFRIVFPILKPITMTVIILNGIWIWNDFLLPMLVLGSFGRVQTLPLAVASFVGSFSRKWDLILTAALMAMMPAIAVFLFLQKYIIKGMVDGSVKG
jgi:raffinose/stachyose/melibiose transport system permease protein